MNGRPDVVPIPDEGNYADRPFVRFIACEQDLSHELPDGPLTDAVTTGEEAFLIEGAIAGG